MTEVETNFHLPPRLNIESIRASSSISQAKPLFSYHAKLDNLSLPFQTKSTPRTGPTSTQEDVLDLNAIMDNYNQESKQTEHIATEKPLHSDLNFEEDIKNDFIDNDDIDETEKAIKRPVQTDIFNDSNLLGSSNLSSYIMGNDKMSQHQGFFQQQPDDLQIVKKFYWILANI